MFDLIEKIWNYYDKDHNGILEGEEYHKFIRELCESCKLQGYEQNIASLIDKNKDGKITKAEIYKFLKWKEV